MKEMKMNEIEIYTDLVYGKYKSIETPNDVKHRFCFLALQSVIKRDFIEAHKFLERAANSEKEECYIQFEAKVLLFYFSGDFRKAKDFALQTIELEEKSFYSRSVLARLAGLEKDFLHQKKYFEEILELYPGHSSTLLDLAQAILSGKGSYQSAINFAQEAEHSFRRFMYLRLIPLSNPFVRLIIVLICLLLFFLVPNGLVGLILINMVAIICLVVSIIKLRWDSLIVSRIFTLQFIAVVSWVLFSLIYSN